jgi:hypothetical protein
MQLHKKIYKFFTLLTIFSFTLSCNLIFPKEHCPSYKDEILDEWFPYNNNEVITFKSNTNKTYSIKMLLTDSSVEDTNEMMYTEFENVCAANKSYNRHLVDKEGNAGFGVYLSYLTQPNDSRNRYADIILFGNSYSGSYLTENGFEEFSKAGNKIIPTTFFNYDFNGTKYDVVQIITDSTGNSIHKFIIAKKEGLIGYETNKGKEIWAKQKS